MRYEFGERYRDGGMKKAGNWSIGHSGRDATDTEEGVHT